MLLESHKAMVPLSKPIWGSRKALMPWSWAMCHPGAMCCYVLQDSELSESAHSVYTFLFLLVCHHRCNPSMHSHCKTFSIANKSKVLLTVAQPLHYCSSVSLLDLSLCFYLEMCTYTAHYRHTAAAHVVLLALCFSLHKWYIYRSFGNSFFHLLRTI